jgi:hypothetical protein
MSKNKPLVERSDIDGKKKVTLTQSDFDYQDKTYEVSVTRNGYQWTTSSMNLEHLAMLRDALEEFFKIVLPYVKPGDNDPQMASMVHWPWNVGEGDDNQRMLALVRSAIAHPNHITRYFCQEILAHQIVDAKRSKLPEGVNDGNTKPKASGGTTRGMSNAAPDTNAAGGSDSVAAKGGGCDSGQSV